MAELIANTHVPGHGWWGPAHDRTAPPPEVAALITNPACWDEAPAGERPPAPVDLTRPAGWKAQRAGAAQTPDVDDLSGDALAAVAAAEGVHLDGSWKDARIRREIKAARTAIERDA